MTTEIAVAAKPQQFDLSPKSFEQALTLADYLADSDLVPKDFKGKSGNCLVAIQWGMELGLKPLQAMQNLAIINGRPSLWGDAVIALVRGSGLCEYVIETQTDDVATCRVKRRGEPEQERTFSKMDAKLAGLLGKQGPWAQYPKRMMQMRARAFAMRDVFPDVLRGLPVAEEVMDAPKNMGAVVEVHAPSASDELIGRAEAAASMGVAAYSEFWKGLSQEDRKSIGRDRHELLKSVATGADQSRTVESKQPATKSFAEIMAMMCQAQSEDALGVALDWVNALTDNDEVQILNDKYDERLAEMRGA